MEHRRRTCRTPFGISNPHLILNLLIHVRKILSSLESAPKSVSVKKTMAPAMSSTTPKTRLCKTPITPKALVFGLLWRLPVGTSLLLQLLPPISIVSPLQTAVNVSASSILLVAPQLQKSNTLRAELIRDLREAGYCGFLASYAQGMNLIARASHEEKWGVNLADCIQIWRVGCIIESEYIANLLQPVYKKEQGTTNIY